MKKFFSKIKNGIGKALTNVKKAFVNLKDKIKNTFNKIRNRNNKNKEIIKMGNNPVTSNKNIKDISKEKHKMVNDSIDLTNSDTKFRTTGYDTIVMGGTQNKVTSQKETSNIINRDNENYLQKEQEKIGSTIENENAERIVSINIKENIGIVEFETITGKKYQKNIDDILREKKNIYKEWNINKKCNDFAKNKIQALRLRRKLNPVVISTLNNEEDIDNYIKCVRDAEKIWFNLEHNLIDSKLKGKNAKLMKRVGKNEEKIGAKVKRKESLIERMLKKIKTNSKDFEEITEELEDIEKNNDKLDEIEEEIIGDIKQVENKKSKKGEKLAKKEFNERYDYYASLIVKLYGIEPRKKIEEIMKDVIDRDIYNLTDKDAWIRAVATFNTGHRLFMVNPKEAKKYLISAYDQFNNEELLTKNENAFQYLEDTLLNLQELYIKEGNYREVTKLNNEYMYIVEREKKEKFNPMILESRKNCSQIKEIDLMIEYRKKYVAGQKVAMKMLHRAGYKFEAEELYRKILNESGIVLTDEAYDLSLEENCIENGKYIVIANGVTHREPILGNERYLELKNKLTQQLIKNKMNNEAMVQLEIETEPTEETVKSKTKSEPTEIIVDSKVEPKVEQKIEKNEIKEEIKKKGILARTKEVVENISKERTEKAKEKRVKEEQMRKQREEQKKREEEEKRKLEEQRKREEEEKRKLEEKKKVELTEFNKRYNNYNVLARGILEESAKRNIEDIRRDVLHNDIYDMTSDDEATKGIATFRVGHRLATIPTKKKEAERLLKASTSILNSDEVLSKDDSLIGILQNAHMDLGNLYLMNDDYINAEKSFVDYMETVRKEKVERYDPKILEAKKNGKVIDEIDLWMEVKSKFTAGKKSMIRMLSKSGRTGEAEELYKKLLADCKISLSDEEYQLSVDTNCIENGQYMRITKGRTYREPILGNEYLLLRRRNISNKALSER